jgi:hypothetical protein
MLVLGVATLFVLSGEAAALRQEPTPPQPPASAQTAPSAPTSGKSKKPQYSHANDFLILGTVFDEKGFSFPGVQLRIRRSDEKKFRWDTYTNSRGEFAVRVPQGSAYEMIVHIKGFVDQKRTMDAKSGLSETRLVFRMEPVAGERR